MMLESLAALVLISLPAGPRPAAAAPPAVQEDHQKSYSEFVARFQQYMKVNNAEEMARLVGRQTSVAVRFADTLCQQVSTQSNEQLEKTVAALRTAWRTAMDTGFVDNLYEYHSLLGARQKADRARLTESYDKALARHLEARAGHDNGPALEVSADEFRGLAQAFAQVGDQLNVGRCWTIVGACLDEGLRHEQANLYQAYQALAKALEAYNKVELAGPDLISVRERAQFLENHGYAEPEPDPDAPKPGQPVAAADVPALTATMAFEAIERLDDFERPNYFADDLYQIWPPLSMQGKGTSASFNSISEGSPLVERTAAAEFIVRDASAQEREPVTVTGNMTVVPATLEDAQGRREWAFAAIAGLERDIYQGRQTNMGPSDLYLSLFYFNAASVVGELNGVGLRVIDDNMDGIYGSMPLRWQYIGLVKDAAQPDMDAVVIGKSKRALPWSAVQQIGDAWFRLEALDGGLTLSATPVELETGTVKLAYKGEFPEWLVLKGLDALDGCYYDVLANGKKGVSIPVGDYELFGGLIRKGKKQQAMKCLILPGAEMPPWKVEAGKETVLELGGPFRFEFEVRKSPGSLTVSGTSVVVVGQAGETYDRYWNCVPEPEVSLRRAGSKKGGKGEPMPKVVGDLDELTEDGKRKWSFLDVWRPMDLELHTPQGEYEAQLSEKKNKLFGKIESDWK